LIGVIREVWRTAPEKARRQIGPQDILTHEEKVAGNQGVIEGNKREARSKRRVLGTASCALCKAQPTGKVTSVRPTMSPHTRKEAMSSAWRKNLH
jgi:hypothetical protein